MDGKSWVNQKADTIRLVSSLRITPSCFAPVVSRNHSGAESWGGLTCFDHIDDISR